MALVVAFEGLSGSGKSTIIKKLIKTLHARGFRTAVTDMGTVRHARMLLPIAKKYPPRSRFRSLIYWALRIEQSEAIKKAENVDIIFADRFWGSTMACDGYGNSAPLKIFEWIGESVECEPDITLFFKIPREVARKRKDAKTLRDEEFARRTEKGYEELAESKGWIRVDASREPKEIEQFCLEIINEALVKKQKTKPRA